MVTYIRRSALASLLVLVLAAACSPAERAEPVPEEGQGVVNIIARGLSFEAPDEIPSGWTTFRFTNGSPLTHFALVERMPEGFGIAEQQQQLAPVFQEGMDLLNAGEAEAAMEAFGELPEWFGQIVFMGGPGLTSPGHTSQATVYLEPGTYLLECYVKTDGIFHSYNPDPSVYGMVREFKVTEQASGAPEPSPTIRITLSSDRGIEVDGDPLPGEHTVGVLFEDQTTHENFAGHDVHLMRLTVDTDLDRVARWMDWSQPMGLETPAPAEFVGGTNELPAGGTAYFNVRLEPGRYAWVAEVSRPAEKGMLRVFTVPSSGG